MIDLVTLLGFMVVLAALADSALNQSTKDKIANFAFNSNGVNRFDLPLNRLADRWLGQRLISFKSLRRSAYFSIIAIIISLIAAGFPNWAFIPDVIRFIYLNSTNGMLVLSVSLIGCVCADFVSIIQTRIFARSIEKFRNGAISFLLCVADLSMSLTFFVFIFSAFRVACYAIVIKTMVSGTYDYKVKVYPSIVYKTLESFPNARDALGKFSPSTETKGQGGLLQAVYAAGKLGENVKPGDVAKKMRDVELAGFNLSKVGSSYTAIPECFDGPASARHVAPNAYEAYASTYNLMYNGLREVDRSLPVTSIMKRFEAEFQQDIIASGICKSRGFTLVKKYDAGALLRELSLGDAYLGAFTLTLRDTFSSISTKLAAYYTVDLSDELSDFLRSGWMAKSQTFLGANGENPKARSVGSYIASSEIRSREYAIVPITTYIVSSMSISLLLVLSVLFQYFLSLTGYLRQSAQAVVNRDYIRKSVMTSLALVVSIILLAFALAQRILGFLWQLVI